MNDTIKRLMELNRKITEIENFQRAQGKGVTTPICDRDYQNFHNACRTKLPALLEAIEVAVEALNKLRNKWDKHPNVGNNVSYRLVDTALSKIHSLLGGKE